MMYFSPSTMSFYDEFSSLPEDVIELTIRKYKTMISGIESGKIIVLNEKNIPVLKEQEVDPQEELTRLENKKSELINEAINEIAWRKYAVEKNIATDEEKEKLDEWEMYRVNLMRSDTSKEWPEKPV